MVEMEGYRDNIENNEILVWCEYVNLLDFIDILFRIAFKDKID